VPAASARSHLELGPVGRVEKTAARPPLARSARDSPPARSHSGGFGRPLFNALLVALLVALPRARRHDGAPKPLESSPCPQCGRDAPIVYRGLVPSCTACGALRQPLSGPSVNMAGKPSKIGGVVTGVLGWLVLLFGLSIALGLGVLFYVLWKPLVALAAVLMAISLGIGIPLVWGGRALRRSGTDVERQTREQALLSLLSQLGRVSAVRAAGALGVRVEEADALLTALAKGQPDRVALDVDEDGAVWYRGAALAHTPASVWAAPARVRVGARAAQEQGEAEGESEEAEAKAGEKPAT